MRTAVLIVHLTGGVAGLVLGVPALAGNRLALRAFHHVMAVVCATAVALAAMDWTTLWWFVPIAAASYGFALCAYVGERHGADVRAGVAVRGVGGGYISLWTALLVVSAPDLPVLWLVPTALGVVPIEVMAHGGTAAVRTSLQRSLRVTSACRR